ncbi:hypothetical protein [Streptomyces rimosus]|uniref:hypothetical protein n=1 Tax=Streptomyces rimosus TaxID=1927 RepID=UPI0033EF3343
MGPRGARQGDTAAARLYVRQHLGRRADDLGGRGFGDPRVVLGLTQRQRPPRAEFGPDQVHHPGREAFGVLVLGVAPGLSGSLPGLAYVAVQHAESVQGLLAVRALLGVRAGERGRARVPARVAIPLRPHG